MTARISRLCLGGAKGSKPLCQVSPVDYMKHWILAFFFFFLLLKFKYGNVIRVETYSKSSKVCVFEQAAVGERWWEWKMAEIRQERVPFLLCLQLYHRCA